MVSGLGSVGTVVDATADVRVVETWRAAGLLFFGGVFVLLALRPNGYRGLWELSLANKLLLTVLTLLYGATGSATDAWTTAAADGALFVILAVAYVVCRGWRSTA